MGEKLYVSSCTTEASFDCARAENEARDMDITDYASPQIVGVYRTAEKALVTSMQEVWKEIEELYDGNSEDEQADLQGLRDSAEWVQVRYDSDTASFVDQPINYSCPMVPPGHAQGRPCYVAALITRNSTNKNEWDFEGCVVVQELELE